MACRFRQPHAAGRASCADLSQATHPDIRAILRRIALPRRQGETLPTRVH
jgi:hypothetical protein